MALLQDSKGFLWIGTQGGLNRYDGHRFKIFKPQPPDSTTLSDGFIHALLEDRAGILWVGTRNGGLNRFDPETEQFRSYKQDPANPNGINVNGVLSLYQGPSGKLWIGTLGGGLLRFDPAAKSFTPFNALFDKESNWQILTLYEAPSQPNRLWIGSNKGLDLLDLQTLQVIPLSPFVEAGSALPGLVRSLCEDSEGILWIGAGDGLYRYDPLRATLSRYKKQVAGSEILWDSAIASIIPGDDGMLWIGTRENGLYYFDPKTGQVVHYFREDGKPHTLSDDNVRALYRDRSNMLWIGTVGNGLNKYNLAREAFKRYSYTQHKQQKLSLGRALAIHEDHTETLWIGTGAASLNKLDRRNGTLIHYPDTPSPRIYEIYEDQAGRLWMGTNDNALHQFDPATGETRPVNLPGSVQTIQTILELSQQPDELWVGTSGAGLYRVDAVNKRVIRHYYPNPQDSNSISHHHIWDLFEDQSGTLWVATFGEGLNRYHPDTDDFAPYRFDPLNPNSISSNKITALGQDNQGRLWIGTYDRGLNRFDGKTGHFHRYTEEDGLPADDIGDLIQDRAGNLWMSTSKGLSMFDPQTEQFTNYDASDGLQDNIFYSDTAYRGRDGRLYFGSVNGFYVFDPEDVKVNRHRPPVVLTNILVQNEPILLGSTTGVLELPYDQNFLAFEFAALDFTAPSKNQYRYILENEDNVWYEAGNESSARYTNLDPGTYIFKVQGSNNHGVWNTEGTALHIVIDPPWWRTWWFYSLVALAVIGLVTAAYRYRVARLLEMVHLRIRIASDLHDDLGGKLSGIALMTDMVQRRTTFDETARQRLAQVSNTARHMVDELRDIVWFITPEYDKLDDTLTKMQNVTEMLLGEINYTFYHPEHIKGEGLAMEFRRHFLLCYKEILHNVVRHAQATNIEIRLGLERGRLILTVADDGVGFDPEAVSNGNGLKNMRHRATLMNGTVEIESRPGKGTTVKLIAKTT